MRVPRQHHRRARAEVHIVYRLNREARYHFIGITLIVFMLAMAWIASTPSASSDHGGEPAVPGPVTQVLLLMLGFTPWVAWLWFSRRFVRLIGWHAGSGEVELHFFRHLGRARLRVPLSDFGTSSRHEGRSWSPSAPSVRAPYTRVFVRGRSCIIDEQGDVLDRSGLNNILAGRAPGKRR